MVKLQCASRNIFEWFFDKAMKANPDKYHFLSSPDMNTKIPGSSFDIENTHSQKFLGVTIDGKLNFHVRFYVKKSRMELFGENSKRLKAAN